MKPQIIIRIAVIALAAGTAQAQPPLAKPLAEFDKLVAELKSSNVVAEPIRVGDTTVVPFARIQFGLGEGSMAPAFGGGMGAKTTPIGVVIVEGDDVRIDLLPQQEAPPSALHQLIQAIMDRKVTIMGNGVNLGNASGSVTDLTEMVKAMAAELQGKTNVMGNLFNVGDLHEPKPPAPTSAPCTAAAMEEYNAALKKDASQPDVLLRRGTCRMNAEAGSRDLVGAIADFKAAIGQKPSAGAYVDLGDALRLNGSKDEAAAAYRKALELQPANAAAAKGLAGLSKGQ